MDLCYVRPDKLIRFGEMREINIEFLGANSRGSGLIERHYLIDGVENVVIAGVDSMTIEQDYDQIKRFYKTFMLVKYGNL